MQLLLLTLSLVHAGFVVMPGKCTYDGNAQTRGEKIQEGKVTHFKCAQICLTATDGCTGYEYNHVTDQCIYHTRRIDSVGGDGDDDVECYYREREEWCQATNEFYPHGQPTCKYLKGVATIEECQERCVKATLYKCTTLVHDSDYKQCWHYCGGAAVKTMPEKWKTTRKLMTRLCGDGGCSSDADCVDGKESCKFTDMVGHCVPLSAEGAFLANAEYSTTEEKLQSYGLYLLALVGIVAVIYSFTRSGQRKETYTPIRTHAVPNYNTA